MRLTYFGHSCFVIEPPGTRLVIDPYLSSNPHGAVDPARDLVTSTAASLPTPRSPLSVDVRTWFYPTLPPSSRRAIYAPRISRIPPAIPLNASMHGCGWLVMPTTGS